jgi:hypothetical protein
VTNFGRPVLSATAANTENLMLIRRLAHLIVSIGELNAMAPKLRRISALVRITVSLAVAQDESPV